MAFLWLWWLLIELLGVLRKYGLAPHSAPCHGRAQTFGADPLPFANVSARINAARPGVKANRARLDQISSWIHHVHNPAFPAGAFLSLQHHRVLCHAAVVRDQFPSCIGCRLLSPFLSPLSRASLLRPHRSAFRNRLRWECVREENAQHETHESAKERLVSSVPLMYVNKDIKLIFNY